jgi:hypothetical protein
MALPGCSYTEILYASLAGTHTCALPAVCCSPCSQAFHDRKIGEPVGHDLPGKVLGLVGLGRVGRCLAASAKALGMTVVSTDSTSSRCGSCVGFYLFCEPGLLGSTCVCALVQPLPSAQQTIDCALRGHCWHKQSHVVDARVC